MELKLIKIKKSPGIYYQKLYEYGNYKITVDIEDGDIPTIIAEDKNKYAEIIATGNNEATMSFNNVIIRSKDVNAFFSSVKAGTELLNIFDNNRKEIYKKED